ncbi:A disintegrin and metalloproteinase with thrombospondin motifs like [Amblyomma americanum]
MLHKGNWTHEDEVVQQHIMDVSGVAEVSGELSHELPTEGGAKTSALNNGTGPPARTKKQESPSLDPKPTDPGLPGSAASNPMLAAQVPFVTQRSRELNTSSVESVEALEPVNIKLEDLKAPRVQLRLAGLMIGDAMGCVGEMIQRKTTLPRLKRLPLLISELHHLRPGVGNPDIFFLLTGYDLIGLINNVLEPALSGLSPLGGMCVWGTNALISEDKFNSFSGIEVAAHEFGHMLGAPHDVFPQYEAQCGWNLGYIMSYLDGGQRKHLFSPCSKYLIQLSLSQKPQSCFDLTFIVDYLTFLPGLYPGAVADGKTFCEARHPNVQNIYFPKQSPHMLLQCRVTCNVPLDSYGSYYYFVEHALEGTPCYQDDPSYIELMEMMTCNEQHESAAA